MFSTEEEAKTEAERFVELKKLVNTPYLSTWARFPEHTRAVEAIQEQFYRKLESKVFIIGGSHYSEIRIG